MASDLVVNLSANATLLKKGLSDAQGGLKSFASSAMSLMNPVTAGFAAMAVGAVGVGAAIWGLQSRIGDLAGVADRAAQTGLSGKFLQQLEFAADQSGVSAETLTGAVKKFTLTVGKAADGSKQAADDLKAFGLSAQDLKSLSPEKQFLKISEAIGNIPTASGRATAAVKVFGKSGIEMTTLFAGGLDDITKLMQDAKDIGIGLDDKSLSQIAEADDALQKMYASIQAMVDQVVVGLAPAFKEVAAQVTDLIGPVTRLFATFNSMEGKWSWLGDTIVAAFDVGIETIKVHWQEMLTELLTQVASFGMDVAEFSVTMTSPTLMMQKGLEMMRGSGVGAGAPSQGLNEAEGRLAELLKKFAEQNKANEVANNVAVNPLQAAEAAKGESLGKYEAEISKRKQARVDLDIASARLEGDSAALLEGLNDPNLTRGMMDYLQKQDAASEAAYQKAGAMFDAAIASEEAANIEYTQTTIALEKLQEGKKKEDSQTAFNSGISSMFDKLKDSPLMGTIDSLKMGAEGMVDRAKLQVDAGMGMLTNWLGTDRKKKEKEVAPRLSGAMAGGSAEAYSAIVQAMVRRGKDPNVLATEKQTKELVKALKDNKPTPMLAMGATE